MQKFDVSKIQLAVGSDDSAAIASKVFEIDGHKFLAVNTASSDTTVAANENQDYFTDVQRKALADDINVIEVNSTNGSAAVTASDATATGTTAGTGAFTFDKDTVTATADATLYYDGANGWKLTDATGAAVTLSDYGITGTSGVWGTGDTIAFTAAVTAADAVLPGVEANSSVDKISAEISRVTGFKTSVADAANTDANIKANDILFTEDTLKLNGNDLSLQVGDTNASYQKVNVKIQDMSSAGLGLTGLDLSNQESAGNAIDTIKNAVNKVSLQRGQLGATQNRLDHTLNNLDATTQNITAAESQIRDVDMAKEMTEYSKNNILVQAAQSMLAQANSLPQGVLQLLG
jgi:flagellin